MDEVETKSKASGSSNVADDDDDDHLQQQIQERQLSSCCQCVPCNCQCHNVNAGTTAAAAANEDAPYLDSLPIGYRFNPTDRELITHYLLKKIQNQTLPKNKISEANVYEHHPKDLVDNYPQTTEGVWYLFTSRNRKYVLGKRPNRNAGSGHWKATGPDEVIEDNGIKIGGKKSLVYHEGHQSNPTKTNWMMHEYVVQGYERERPDLADMKLDDYVLCKIYYKADRRKQIIEQAVTNQQPDEASNRRNETLRTNLDDENQRALVPNQQENVDTNQGTSHTDGNNVVIQHLDQNSNPAAIHHVENSIPVQSSNQHMNPIVQNRYDEANSHDQQARVVYHQNLNIPTILQVRNNIVAQNYQNVGCIQMASFRGLIPPFEHYSFWPSGFNHPHLPSTPRQPPPLPPRVVQEQPHPGMNLSGQSSTPATTSAQAELTDFQRMIAEGARNRDRHEQLDADDLGPN